MKLVVFEDANKNQHPGLLTDRGVIDISAVAAAHTHSMQELVASIIDRFDSLRPELEKQLASGKVIPLDQVRLRAPLPRPSKILCAIGNYWEHQKREKRPLNMFLKSPEAIIGPGDTLVLPHFTAEVFQHEAELGLVIKGPAKAVKAADWRKAVFGYTAFIDGSARDTGRRSWRAGSFLGKSFDTFCPIGPCIVTADEIPNPNKLHVQFWNNEQLRHDYNTDDMEHQVPEIIEFATNVMTLNSGDLIACGTNHEGLGPMQDGETCTIEVEKIGRFSIHISDPLKRKWERGIYMGPESTHPDAVRAREQAEKAQAQKA
jgi:2-keto-4-pentenoate hydratase/2-oxohepta-3-ene-1,7-dioic acid hydratase in catechol pathway